MGILEKKRERLIMKILAKYQDLTFMVFFFFNSILVQVQASENLKVNG